MTQLQPKFQLWKPKDKELRFCVLSFNIIVIVQSLSCVQLFGTPSTAVHQAPLSFTISWSFLILMSIESMMPSNHLILCRPLLLLPLIFTSIRVFSNQTALGIRWQKYWCFSFNISPSNECSGLICCRIYWFKLLAVQGTLKNLLQHHRSKASVLWHWPFFIVQLSHPCMTKGKAIALTVWTFAGKVMSLFFNMLSLDCFSSKEHGSSNFMVVVTICSDFRAQENKVCHCFHCFPSIFDEVMGPDAMISIFECWILSQFFHSPLSPSSRGSLIPLHFLT